MVFLGITHAAMSHYRCFACAIAGFGAEKLRGVGFSTTGHSLVIQPGATLIQKRTCFKIDPSLSQGMLDTLVLTNLTIEDNPFSRVLRCPPQRCTTKACCFSGQ